jgi:hypothetical protein
MAIKHKVVINVSDPKGRKANVLRGADVKLPTRLLRFLFGDFTQVYLLSPGQTVESVNTPTAMNSGTALPYPAVGNTECSTRREPCQGQALRVAAFSPSGSESWNSSMTLLLECLLSVRNCLP